MRLKGRAHVWVDLSPGAFQCELLQYAGQHDFRLYLGEGCADANPRPAAEGQIGEGGHALPVCAETLRPERPRFIPESFVAMGQINRRHYPGARLQLVTADGGVVDHKAIADVD